jgi:hypothetical protein
MLTHTRNLQTTTNKPIHGGWLMYQAWAIRSLNSQIAKVGRCDISSTGTKRVHTPIEVFLINEVKIYRISVTLRLFLSLTLLEHRKYRRSRTNLTFWSRWISKIRSSWSESCYYRVVFVCDDRILLTFQQSYFQFVALDRSLPMMCCHFRSHWTFVVLVERWANFIESTVEGILIFLFASM